MISLSFRFISEIKNTVELEKNYQSDSQNPDINRKNNFNTYNAEKACNKFKPISDLKKLLRNWY